MTSRIKLPNTGSAHSLDAGKEDPAAVHARHASHPTGSATSLTKAERKRATSTRAHATRAKLGLLKRS